MVQKAGNTTVIFNRNDEVEASVITDEAVVLVTYQHNETNSSTMSGIPDIIGMTEIIEYRSYPYPYRRYSCRWRNSAMY